MFSSTSSQASTISSTNTKTSNSSISSFTNSLHWDRAAKTLGNTAFKALYNPSKTKTSISHLEPHEMVWLVECLKHPSNTYHNDAELQQRSLKLIDALPANLRNPLTGARISQSSLTRFCGKIGASADTLPQASTLCLKHSALSGQLTASLRNYIEYVAEDLREDVCEPMGKKTVFRDATTETLTLFQRSEDVMALSIDRHEFEAVYRHIPPPHLEPTQCDACFMTQVLQDADTICGLRGIALRACEAGITDDNGTDRMVACKMLLEACMATWPKEETLLMVKISDAMAAELARLVAKARLEEHALLSPPPLNINKPLPPKPSFSLRSEYSHESLKPKPLKVKKAAQRRSVLEMCKTGSITETPTEYSKLQKLWAKATKKRSSGSSKRSSKDSKRDSAESTASQWGRATTAALETPRKQTAEPKVGYRPAGVVSQALTSNSHYYQRDRAPSDGRSSSARGPAPTLRSTTSRAPAPASRITTRPPRVQDTTAQLRDNFESWQSNRAAPSPLSPGANEVFDELQLGPWDRMYLNGKCPVPPMSARSMADLVCVAEDGGKKEETGSEDEDGFRYRDDLGY